MKRLAYVSITILICSILAVSWFLRAPTTPSTPAPHPSPRPEHVLKQYLAAVYARDFSTAYQWVSAEDRIVKSQEEYLRENPSFSGSVLRLIHGLAEKIEFINIREKVTGDRATLEFKVKLPDASDPILQRIFMEFDLDLLNHLSALESQEIEQQIRALDQEGKLPMLEGEEQWQLIKEADGWRVYLNWTGATTVWFEARVMDGLPWEFEPVQGYVAAKSGETLQALYRVKNVSTQTITAKARHLDEPKELAAKHLEIVQCFCFIQQTLAPGEEKELPLVFRIHWDAPAEPREFRVTYEFYPLDKFPAS